MPQQDERSFPDATTASRMAEVRDRLSRVALALASVEQDLARTFRWVASTSPHRSARLLRQAQEAEKLAVVARRRGQAAEGTGDRTLRVIRG